MNSDYSFIYKNKSLNKKERKKVIRQKKYEELKKIVPFPELLDIEDLKCEDIIKYNKLKSMYKGVHVIKRWKHKNIFPLNYKQKEYEIPASIIDTGLDLLRFNIYEYKKIQTDKEKFIQKIFPKPGKSCINPSKLYDCIYKSNNYTTLKYGHVFDFTWECEKTRFVPGQLTDELKKALGMTEFSPPPWLFKMQEIGLPPAYQDLKIPGVNSDIPPGCKYGFEPNNWGRAPQNFEPKERDEYIYNLETQYTEIKSLKEKTEKIIEEKKINVNFSNVTNDKQDVEFLNENVKQQVLIDKNLHENTYVDSKKTLENHFSNSAIKKIKKIRKKIKREILSKI
ncbi:splicing factor 3b [Vairimorpha apis BRL 01]|uniref:Splicing factor 3b n=1 Tax=Vairimorpha apis BRL 01 TaxID=1037528 RepID=T0MEE9_9MICR|nr:splicing factor 3b [Vairimorpha apis BRL 01]